MEIPDGPAPAKFGTIEHAFERGIEVALERMQNPEAATAFVAEHVCVMEDKLPLGLTEPTGIHQRFVSTHKGTGIQYEEYCDDVDINFTILTDHKFTDEQWAMIWLTGEQQGIGATRSQGYGRYMVTQWETVHSPKS